VDWRHLVVDASDGTELPSTVGSGDGRILLASVDGLLPMVLGAMSNQLTTPIAVWTQIDSDYSSPLAARDLGTLSWLVDLRDVVVSTTVGDVQDHAAVIAALLRDDNVTMVTPSVSVTEAYNRPLPPRPLTVWVTTDSPTDDVVHLRLANGADADGTDTVIESVRWSEGSNPTT
jgi:hypothetical protein